MAGDKNEQKRADDIITKIFEKQKKQLKEEDDIEMASRFEYGAKQVVKGNETEFLSYIDVIQKNAELKMEYVPGFHPARGATVDAKQMDALPESERPVIIKAQQTEKDAEELLKKSLSENARMLVGSKAVADGLINQLLGNLSQEYLALEADRIEAQFKVDLQQKIEKTAAGLLPELAALKASPTDAARQKTTEALKTKINEKDLPQKEKDLIFKRLVEKTSAPAATPGLPLNVPQATLPHKHGVGQTMRGAA